MVLLSSPPLSLSLGWRLRRYVPRTRKPNCPLSSLSLATSSLVLVLSCEWKSRGMVDLGLGDSKSTVLKTNSSFGLTGSTTSVSNLPAAIGTGGEEVGLVQVQDLK